MTFPEPVVVDSITDVRPADTARVVVTGSHGGLFTGDRAARLGVRALIANDAAGGLDGAGTAGLEMLQERGVPAAAVSHLSACIGNGADTATNGRLSTVNRAAEALGARVGMAATEAIELFRRAPSVPPTTMPSVKEVRSQVRVGGLIVTTLDSASLVTTQDDGGILAIGSHGGSPGGLPERALRCHASLAAFNDAGIGKDDAGATRLPHLQDRGVPAVVVSAATARIGDGLSTLDGVISRANELALALGARPGITFRQAIEHLALPPDLKTEGVA